MKLRSNTSWLTPGVLALVLSLACGGDTPGSTEPENNPVPTLTGLSRDTATGGIPPFVVTVKGHGFVTGAIATVDGSARTTNVANDSTALVQIVAADLSVAGAHEVRVKNPDPTDGPSAPLNFQVFAAPAPTIDSLSPDTVVSAGPNFTLHVHGTGFLPQSVIKWGGLQLATTHVSSTHLSGTVAASLVATPGTASVSVYTPAPGGGTSTPRYVLVAGMPVITGMDPDPVVWGDDTIPLTIYGRHFTGVDSVSVANQGNTRWLMPNASNDTMVMVWLDRSWISYLGVFSVRVHTIIGASTTADFEIVAPPAVITGFTPDTLDGSATADTFVVHGHGFRPGMIARLNGTPVDTTIVQSRDSLIAIVDAGGLFQGGVQPVTVLDPVEPNVSAPMSIAIQSPAPLVDSLEGPGVDSAGSLGHHTLWGTGFRMNGEVLVDGVARPPAYVYADAVVFPLLPGEAVAGDTLSIAYRTPGPGGGTSAPFPLRIVAANPVPVIDSVAPRVVRSDSGTQVITLFGHGFVAGSTTDLVSEYLGSGEVRSVQVIQQSDTQLVVQFPDSLLATGRRHYIGVRAPFPTAGASERVAVPVWTTGVRNVTELPGEPVYIWVTDSIRDRMYGRTYLDGNSTLVSRNASTGAVLGTIQLPGSDVRLAMDDSARYLYAVTDAFQLSRIDLAAWHMDWTIDLFKVNGNTVIGVFVAPVPGQPGTFVLSGNLTGNEYGNFLRVYDGDTPRATYDTLEQGAFAGRFFGDTLLTVGGYHVRRWTLGPTGLTQVDSTPLADLTPAPGRILSRERLQVDGRLVDLTTGLTVAAHPDLVGTAALGGDPAVFFVGHGGEPFPHFGVTAFELATGAVLGRIGVPAPRSYANWHGFAVSSAGTFFVGFDEIGVQIIESVLTDP